MAKRVLIVATNGFEQSELLGPKQALESAGYKTTVASLQTGKIKGWHNGNWGESVKVDKLIDDIEVDEYAALLLPGGQMNPDILRMFILGLKQPPIDFLTLRGARRQQFTEFCARV